jgi:hypothetical protein
LATPTTATLPRPARGVDQAALQLGQRIICTVTKRWSFFLSATTSERPTDSLPA